MSDAALFLSLPATIAAVEVVLALKFRSVLAAWAEETRRAPALMRDKTLSDEEKQTQMAAASGALLLGSLRLLGVIVLALAAYALVLLAGAQLLGVNESPASLAMRLDIQGASVLVAFVYLWGRSRVV